MNIYVGNLDYKVHEDQLKEVFEQHGTVNHVKIVTDRETGRSRGFAFVEMADDSAGESAIESLHGSMLGSRSLVVNQARPKEDRPPRRDY